MRFINQGCIRGKMSVSSRQENGRQSQTFDVEFFLSSMYVLKGSYSTSDKKIISEKIP